MASASASSGGLAIAGMHDPRLRPRLLHSLLDGCLPLPDADADLQAPPPQRHADLAYAADAVRAHGLLAETAGSADPGLLEEWRAAVDAWVDRLLELIGSAREHSCWVGTSFLGLTIQECCDGRFVNSYSDWFEKVLKKMKAPSCTKMVNIFTCTTMSDLFVRLATFSSLKDEATFLAKKVVKPSLRLLNENGPVAEKAVDLLVLLMKLFPSSINRYFNKVESTITAKIISGQCNLQQSKKLASSLALLPFVRVSQNSMSLMIQKILIAVNSMLNDTFLGLEEGHSDHELMMLLTPLGRKLEPPLGEQLTYEDGHIHSTKKFHAYVVPTISALIHCCSVMLTSSYPSQVINVPVRALVTVIRKALLVDGSLHKSLFQSNTPFHQELICSEIPTLHSTFLDLLASTVKGMRSSLIPHADVVIMLIAEYFKRARLPAIRRKLYTVVQLLLRSIGVGMAMQLLQVVISNIFADLDGNFRSGLSSLSTDPIEATIWSSSNSSSNRNQMQQQQSSIVVTSEPTSNRQIMAPICAKIAALETLEVLLNVGGSFSACSWRTEMDLLLIDVARNACYKAGMYEQRSPWTEDISISDFQLALFKALLASFLSNPHGRPPYLEQGLELFSRGKLETSTELADFCSHALLALDVLIHPRQLHPQYVSKRMARDDLVFRSGATERVLGSERSQSPCSIRKRRATDDLGDECKHRLVSIAKEPTDALAIDGSAEKHTPVELSRDLSVRKDAQRSNATTEVHPEMATYCLPAEEVQTVPAFIRTDVKMAGGSCITPAGFDTLGNSPASFTVFPAPIVITPSDSRDPGDEISNKKCGYQGGTLSGDAFSSQNVPAHTSPIFAAPSVFGSEWDSLEPLLDIGDDDADADPNFFPDMVNVHSESY